MGVYNGCKVGQCEGISYRIRLRDGQVDWRSRLKKASFRVSPTHFQPPSETAPDDLAEGISW